MNNVTTEPEDFANLYRQAFARYGTQALWNMRSIEDPTPADALAITTAERMAGWRGGAWLNRSKESVVPLTKLQSHVLSALETAIAADATNKHPSRPTAGNLAASIS